MKEQGTLKILVGSLLVGVAGITVAYAALQTSLTTTYSKITSNALSWKVGFDTTSTQVTAEATSTSETGFSCGKATVTETAVSIADTKLSKPDDKCVWPLTIKNTGTIDALLSTVTETSPSGFTCQTETGKIVCGNITYKLALDKNGNNLIQQNTTLVKSNSLAVYLIAQYTGTDVSATEITHSGTKFTLNYTQK